MIHMRRGYFSLIYNPLTDTAQLFYDDSLLVAESPHPDCWNVLNGPTWLYFSRLKRPDVRFGYDLRGRLQHIRAISGTAKDVISMCYRARVVRSRITAPAPRR